MWYVTKYLNSDGECEFESFAWCVALPIDTDTIISFPAIIGYISSDNWECVDPNDKANGIIEL